MAHGYENAVVAARNLEVPPHINEQLTQAEQTLWGCTDLKIIEQGSERGIIVAPTNEVLLAIVRSRHGLHVERHIGESTIPCDYFSLTGNGISWRDLGTQRPKAVGSGDTPSVVLLQVMQRFRDPSPAKGGYLGFIRGDDVASVARRMRAEGHEFRLPLVTWQLGKWGIAGSGYGRTPEADSAE